MAIAALIGLGAVQSAPVRDALPAGSPSVEVTSQLRAELIEARESAWRAFFEGEPGRVEDLLGPELIAIQQSQERWENRGRLAALARDIRQNGVQIARLEFPHTEIQIFGEVAILYYTYIFETAARGRSVADSGRGTEIFVRRNGRWVDVGWHLDSGAFVNRNGAWLRVDTVPPAAAATPVPGP